MTRTDLSCLMGWCEELGDEQGDEMQAVLQSEAVWACQ